MVGRNLLVCLLFLQAMIQACGSSASFTGGLDRFKRTVLNKEVPKQNESLKVEDATATPAGLSLALGCREEASAAPLNGLTSSLWLDLALVPVCPIDDIVENNFEEEKIANIVFVIDLTGSMQNNIDTIINNIIAFSQELTARKWRVNFAAVLFKDEIWKTLPFSTGDVLANQLRRWPAEGGGRNSPQEAGQLALEKAAGLLADFAASHTDMEDFKNIIMMVTDAPAYYKNDRDFTVSALGRKLHTILEPVWENFRLYYSVNGAAPTGTLMPSPLAQMQELAYELNLAPRPLDFPLTKEVIMKQFLGEFNAWIQAEGMSCSLQEASLSGEGAILEVSSYEGQGETSGQVIKGLRLKPEGKIQDLALNLTRCCGTQDELGVACRQELTSRIAISP